MMMMMMVVMMRCYCDWEGDAENPEADAVELTLYLLFGNVTGLHTLK
jgi:hypothetical protein